MTTYVVRIYVSKPKSVFRYVPSYRIQAASALSAKEEAFYRCLLDMRERFGDNEHMFEYSTEVIKEQMTTPGYTPLSSLQEAPEASESDSGYTPYTDLNDQAAQAPEGGYTPYGGFDAELDEEELDEEELAELLYDRLEAAFYRVFKSSTMVTEMLEVFENEGLLDDLTLR